MKTILFVPVTFNLSETIMGIEIARAISGDFHCHFAGYGGDFEPLIEQAGFPLTKLERLFTPQMVRRVYGFDQGRRVGEMYPAKTIRRLVSGELELFKALQPDAVVTGMQPTICISSQAARIPLIWYIQSGKMLSTAARLGKLKKMDMLDSVPLRWLPDGFKWKLSETLMDFSFELICRSFNHVAVEYGLKPYQNYDEVLWRSLFQVVSEPAGFSDFPFPPSATFLGPVIARLDVPLPEEVLNLPRDLPIVYFAMGSSGRPNIVARIIAGFAGKPYRVIAPVRKLLDANLLRVPSNVLITEWLPALEVNRMADIAVIHGGIGTVLTACLAGKPIVGVAMSPEQYINLECIVEKGFAIRISRGDLNPERLCNSIDNLLANSNAREKACQYQKEIEQWDVPEQTRRIFLEKLGCDSQARRSIFSPKQA